MTNKCQCEHRDHEYACDGAPVVVKDTDYGPYAICQECVDAGHLSAFPMIKTKADNHGYPINNADRMDHDGAEDLADIRECGPFCRGCGANLRIEGHLADCEYLPDQDAIEAREESDDFPVRVLEDDAEEANIMTASELREANVDNPDVLDALKFIAAHPEARVVVGGGAAPVYRLSRG